VEKLITHTNTYLITVLQPWANNQWPRSRVARWNIFKTKIPNWVNFGGSYNGTCWYILRSVDLFCSYLVHWMVYFMVIWCILWSFGTFFPFWYVASRKIWQPCPDLCLYLLANRTSLVLQSSKVCIFSITISTREN
jgi:hypothetical protein